MLDKNVTVGKVTNRTIFLQLETVHFYDADNHSRINER